MHGLSLKKILSLQSSLAQWAMDQATHVLIELLTKTGKNWLQVGKI